MVWFPVLPLLLVVRLVAGEQLVNQGRELVKCQRYVRPKLDLELSGSLWRRLSLRPQLHVPQHLHLATGSHIAKKHQYRSPRTLQRLLPMQSLMLVRTLEIKVYRYLQDHHLLGQVGPLCVQ